MTDEEARTVVTISENIANSLLIRLRHTCQPHEAVVALGLAAGFVFANLELENDVSIDSVMADWLLAVKAQYTETKKKIESNKTH